MRLSLPITMLAVAAVAAALSAASPTRAQSSPAPSPSASAAATAAAVHIVNFVYTPDTVTVPAGTKVTFTNDDTTAHTVTAADGSFDSKNLDQHQSWSHVFDKAGTYAYVCAYHAFMKGKIIVK